MEPDPPPPVGIDPENHVESNSIGVARGGIRGSQPVVDWSTIEIVPETEDGGNYPMSEEDMCTLLELRDEDNGEVHCDVLSDVDITAGPNCDADDSNDVATIVHDDIPEEQHIAYDRDNPKMERGTLFPSMRDFRLAIRQYAILQEFDIGTAKSDPTRFMGFCKAEGCPWRIVSHRMPDKTTIRVTKIVENHTCTSTSRISSSMASQAWVADRAVNILRYNLNLSTKALQEKLQNDYNCTIGYDTVWRERQRAIDELYGSWDYSFQRLCNFKAELDLRSPGSIVEVATRTVKGEVYFHRFFMALKPCIEGFLAGCRPYLSIDSTALNGKWNGHLAACTALDGHNWMYPVAIGFFQSETEDNWTWFMRQLHRAIGDLPKLAIFTDACKGLENAVKVVFPQAEQRECFRHLMNNFVKKFHGDSSEHMWPAARPYRPEVFEHHMDKVLLACTEVAPYLQRHRKLMWMRCSFNTEIKCDYISNNLVECFNNWVRDVKDMPVDQLADKIREKIMVLIDKRRRIGERLQGRMLPAIMQQIKMRTRGLEHLKVGRSHHGSAEVRDMLNNNLRHVVKIASHECTCLEWQHTGKPCDHALAFLIEKRNINLEDYVHDYYSLQRFRAAYEGAVEPLTDMTQWPKVDLGFVLLPPLAKRSAGRPRKLRIKGCLDKGGIGKKTVNLGTQHRCKRCGELGHRQAGCPLHGTKQRKTKARKNIARTSPATPTRSSLNIDAVAPKGPSQPSVTTTSKKMTPRKKRKT